LHLLTLIKLIGGSLPYKGITQTTIAMGKLLRYLEPDRKGFCADPIGYSASAWHRWAFAQSLAGASIDLEVPPANEDLNSPVLWLTHAHAKAETARAVIQNEPNVGEYTQPSNLIGDKSDVYRVP
jgi:hypothetical protein